MILFIIIYDNKLQLSNREMEKQKQITCNDDESVVPTYNEHTHTPQKRPHDGSDDGSGDDSDDDTPQKRPRYDGSDDNTPQKRPRAGSDDGSDDNSDDGSDGGSGDDSDGGSDDDSDDGSNGDPVKAFEEGRTEIQEDCRKIRKMLEDYSGNPEDPEDPGDLSKKTELSKALLEATSAVVDTYTKLIEVYYVKTFTMKKFDELLSLRRSQDALFLSRRNAILDFVGYKCHC